MFKVNNEPMLSRPRPPAEATVFQPGDRDPVVALEGSTAAVADIGRRPTRSGRGPGGRHVPGEHGRDPLRLRREAAKLGTYAVRHRMLTALANFGGPSGGLRSEGRSAVWSETGELLVRLDANGSGVAVVTEGPQGYRTRAVMAPGFAGRSTPG